MEPDRFAYAILRVVPRVERGEQLNAGVVLFCRRRNFLAVRAELDERGEPAGGSVAALEPSERFGWLVAPSSTMIQPSPVHTGICDDPAAMLDRLFDELVAPVA